LPLLQAVAASANTVAATSKRRTIIWPSSSWVPGFYGSLLAQVCLSNLVVAEEAARRVLEHDLAGLEHIAAVGDLERHVGVLFDQQHRRALAVDLADDLEDPRHHHRSEAERRLVEHHE